MANICDIAALFATKGNPNAEFPQALTEDRSAIPFSCRNVIKDCPCNDEPIANFSAEAPDQQLFCQTVTFTGEFGLGQCIDQISDTEICCSPISRGDAYLCALQIAQETVWGTWKDQTCPVTDPPIDCPTECSPFCPPDCPNPNPVPPTVPNPVHIFLSDAQSCTVNCPDGGTFRYGLLAGKVSSNLSQAHANSLAHALACRIAQQIKICLLVEGDTSGCINDCISFLIVATGPITQSPLLSQWTISGPGIDANIVSYDTNNNAVFGTRTMRIFGTPTIAINTYIIARITDNNTGLFTERIIPIKVSGITTTSLADGFLSHAYSQTILTSGFTAPLTFSITHGSLPDGLSLNSSNGQITGTPTNAGTFTFTVSASGAEGNTCQKQFSINIDQAIVDITVGSLPHLMAFSTSNKLIYVSSRAVGNKVYVFNPSTSLLVTTIGVAGMTGAILYCPATDRIFTARDDENMIVINPNTNVVTNILPIGVLALFSIAYCPFNQLIYFFHDPSSSVRRLNPVTFAVTTITDTFGYLLSSFTNIIYVPATNEVWASDSNSIVIIDVATNATVDKLTPAGLGIADPIAFYPAICVAGDKLYVGNGTTSKFYVIDIPSRTLSATINLIAIGLFDAQFCFYRASNNSVYVSLGSVDKLAVIDCATFNVTYLTTADIPINNPLGMVEAPSVNTKLYVTNSNQDDIVGFI